MKRMQTHIVNRNIERLMVEKRLKRARVAEKAGFSPAVFSKIIRCRRKVYADEVVPIALAMGVEIDELFAAESQSLGNGLT